MSISLLWFWACSSWSILADFLCIGCNLHEFKIPHKKINLLHLLKRSLVCGGNAAYALCLGISDQSSVMPELWFSVDCSIVGTWM